LERSEKAQLHLPCSRHSKALLGRLAFILDFQFAIVDLVQRLRYFALIVFEIVILTALILAARCANYGNVFVAGNVYFIDADCYARMTRVRMCAEYPGLIVRHHDFENFPFGTTPHTTAPLDYAILGLAVALRACTTHSLDLAGAIISPLLGLLGGWFLWWWARQMRFRFRWAMLLLYALSPILVHGSELGRPDHQSVLIFLVMIALGAEWILQTKLSRKWSLISGTAWGLALWVSFYEPLVLLVIIAVCYGIAARNQFTAHHRLPGWIALAFLVTLMFLVEQRIPRFSSSVDPTLLRNWVRSIGELRSVRMNDPIWFDWTGYFLPLTTLLLGWLLYFKRNPLPGLMLVLFVFTYALTVWQARWAYFFVIVLVMILPMCLAAIERRSLGWIVTMLAFLPILQGWDKNLWPDESTIAHDSQQRMAAVQLRELATRLQSKDRRPFLAPWWLSPSIGYWSGQPAVAGSSHESLSGIAESARFFLAADPSAGQPILEKRDVAWVLAVDAEDVIEDSAALLGLSPPANPIARVLSRTPGQAPPFLSLAAQNGTGKIYRVTKFQ
jgi:hypothetical protein